MFLGEQIEHVVKLGHQTITDNSKLGKNNFFILVNYIANWWIFILTAMTCKYLFSKIFSYLFIWGQKEHIIYEKG